MTETEFLNNLTIAVDSQEQLGYEFLGYNTERCPLETGDYTFLKLRDIAIERKTIEDLVGSLCTQKDEITGKVDDRRGRLEAEFQRGSKLDYFAIVIEADLKDIASGSYRSQMLPKSAIQTLISWSVKYNTHVIYAGNREYAEKYTLSLLHKYARQFYQRYHQLSKGAT